MDESMTRLEFLDYLISDEYKFVPVRENDVEVVTEQEFGGDLQDKAWKDRDFLDLMPRMSEIGYIEYTTMTNRNTFEYRVDSVTTEGVNFWFMKLKVHEIDDLAKEYSKQDGFTTTELKEDIKTAIGAGECSVLCDCPSYQYHFQYWLNQKGSKLGPPGYAGKNKADQTNPQGLRLLCKHNSKLLFDILEDDLYLFEMAEDVARKIRVGRYK